ncbi:hypothetical protein CFC21_034973 [Triticum aestivum]|uniref:BTB domain-containing protein n=3 Tax=Triticum TaxID=4564 RepID=A0A9R0RFW8_TRITD|nr:hypothetical protein CFC21_034973 [Triticum aestivum]VAH59715.1 unnamed protein product [Triticum turgidum subsp. durum]
MVYYPDGCDAPDGGSDWISVGLVLRHTAATDFKIRCTFSLLDHAGKPMPRYTTSCQTRTCFHKGDGIASPTFIKKEELEESPSLIGDCFSVKCDVTVTKFRMEYTARQFVMVPTSNIHEQFSRILVTAEVADVIFEVSCETFAAHRCLLAPRSSVFMEQFLQNVQPRVRINDMNPRVFRALLHFIYTDFVPEVDDDETMEMAQALFVAADRYNLQKLKLVCEKTLCNCIDTSMVATALLFAEKHGCVELKKACLKLLSSFQNLKAIRETDDFKNLKAAHPNILEELVANVNTP